MIVCDLGDVWQVVMQPDHAELSGQIAEQWGNGELAAPHPARGVRIASRRHDDGWAVWERAPQLDATGAPATFFKTHIPSHLAFWRAGVAAITEHDPYAGLLVSMHGAGIYRGRYGTQPEMKMALAGDVEQLVDAFVAEQEEGYPQRRADLGADEAETWTNYRFLQVFDRLSLFFCMNDPETSASTTIGSVPTDYAGGETALDAEAVAPFRVALDPYPFAGEATFTLRRRLLPKADFASGDAFREALAGVEAQDVDVVMQPSRVRSG
ncbi:MAG: hypothetical protein QOD81_4219 [Solirubrobacteraceae bacterium]|nr:hypothetical protein [Solirubrobacteraceae bacterium]